MRWMGKPCAGCARRMEEGSEYLLSVYDVKQGKVLSQVEVGRKENEIGKAPASPKIGGNLREKWSPQTHCTPKNGSRLKLWNKVATTCFLSKKISPCCTTTSSNSLRQNIPSLGLGKFQTDFLTAQKVNKGHGRT